MSGVKRNICKMSISDPIAIHTETHWISAARRSSGHVTTSICCNNNQNNDINNNDPTMNYLSINIFHLLHQPIKWQLNNLKWYHIFEYETRLIIITIIVNLQHCELILLINKIIFKNRKCFFFFLISMLNFLLVSCRCSCFSIEGFICCWFENEFIIPITRPIGLSFYTCINGSEPQMHSCSILW